MDVLTDINTDINSFSGQYAFLSNFYMMPVEFNGIKYPSSEHAYQAQKSANNKVQRIFGILPEANDAKILGKNIKMRLDWDQIKDLVMRNIVFAKFNQNPELANLLVKTGSRKLIEGNYWGDTYWGVCKGVGQNKLGEILMQVRNEVAI